MSGATPSQVLQSSAGHKVIHVARKDLQQVVQLFFH